MGPGGHLSHGDRVPRVQGHNDQQSFGASGRCGCSLGLGGSVLCLGIKQRHPLNDQKEKLLEKKIIIKTFR